MREDIILNGIRISGDFKDVERVRVLGSTVVIKNKDGRSFFANYVHKNDEIRFDFEEGLMSQYGVFEGYVKESKAISKNGMIKNSLIDKLPSILFIGTGAAMAGLSKLTGVDPSESLVYTGGVMCGLGVAWYLTRKLYFLNDERKIEKEMKEHNVIAPDEVMKLEGFKSVKKRFGKEIVKE